MPIPFFILRIPDSAEYTITPRFFTCHSKRYPDLFANTLQVVDPRFDANFVNPFPSHQFDKSILEVEDAIISKPVSPILCSTSIFKSIHQMRTARWWEKYVNDIKEKIELYSSDDRFQLRIYVGNSMWPSLDEAGLLSSPNVDFIKMKDSSSGWNIGNMWRILALTNYSYDYVFFDDVHFRKTLDERYDVINQVFTNTDAPIAAGLVSPPTRYLTFLIKSPQSFWDDMSSHFYLPIVEMFPIESFLKTLIFSLYRGPEKLPFTDFPSIIMDCLNKNPLTRIYDLVSNRWTYMQSYCQMYQEADSAEKIMFFLSKVVKMKLSIRKKDLEWYKQGYKEFGDNFFWKRLIEQVNCDLGYMHEGYNPLDDWRSFA